MWASCYQLIQGIAKQKAVRLNDAFLILITLTAMQLIPVIDIKDGIAVHAVKGLRNRYRPINTPLSPSCEIADVIEAFLSVHDFRIMYLADLNAIMQQGDNLHLIEKLLQDYPKICFWIDSGYQAKPSFLTAFGNYRPVLGTECYAEKQVQELKTFGNNFILSLDFSPQNQPLGAASLFNRQDLWPRQVILMTLARVGSNLGVDFEKLNEYRQKNSAVEWVASGGIRNLEDVLALQKRGIGKALCASALHSGSISTDEIKKLQAKKYPD